MGKQDDNVVRSGLQVFNKFVFKWTSGIVLTLTSQWEYGYTSSASNTKTWQKSDGNTMIREGTVTCVGELRQVATPWWVPHSGNY